MDEPKENKDDALNTWLLQVINPGLLFSVTQVEALGLQALLNTGAQSLGSAELIKEIAGNCNKFTKAFDSGVAAPIIRQLEAKGDSVAVEAWKILESRLPAITDLITTAKVIMMANTLFVSKVVNNATSALPLPVDNDYLIKVAAYCFNSATEIEEMRSLDKMEAARTRYIELLEEANGWVDYNKIKDAFEGLPSKKPKTEKKEQSIHDIYAAGL